MIYKKMENFIYNLANKGVVIWVMTFTLFIAPLIPIWFPIYLASMFWNSSKI